MTTERSEAAVFYEGFIRALSIFEHVRDKALTFGEDDPAYRVLSAILEADLRGYGKAASISAYPLYGEDLPEKKIPLEMKGQLDE